jgi:hypothetical protein
MLNFILSGFFVDSDKYPESIEKLNMDGLEVVSDVDSVNYSLRVNLKETQHEVAQPCHQAEGNHVYFAENYLIFIVLGTKDSIPNIPPFSTVSAVIYLTNFLRFCSPD